MAKVCAWDEEQSLTCCGKRAMSLPVVSLKDFLTFSEARKCPDCAASRAVGMKALQSLSGPKESIDFKMRMAFG